MLARIAHDLLPHADDIDLLNVAFENPRVHQKAQGSPFELCPDRVTGRASYAELCQVCPGRKWRFVAVDVPYVEAQEHRPVVLKLMHPHNTEMDLSIAFALYFAARGRGVVSGSPNSHTEEYTTLARVLLSGLGADELFAGYTRHTTAFKRGGVEGLLDELDLDVGRLGKRNLGRDDRVLSHWGREARFPFLDEDLVSWALELPVLSKCDFGVITAAEEGPALEPSKKVLRCLAWKLGIKGVAKEKKRAASWFFTYQTFRD